MAAKVLEAPEMKQSRSMSLFESVANVAIGYAVACISQLIVFPWFGLHVPLRDTLLIGAVFTVISIARSFLLRRAFEAIRVRHLGYAAIAGAIRRWRVRLSDDPVASTVPIRGPR